MVQVGEELGRRTAVQQVELATAAGLPWAPITRPEDLLDDPHLRASGGLAELTLPDGRSAAAPLLPLAWHGTRLPKRLDPPLVGQHTEEVLTSAGLAGAEIDELLARGVAIRAMDPGFPAR